MSKKPRILIVHQNQTHRLKSSFSSGLHEFFAERAAASGYEIQWLGTPAPKSRSEPVLPDLAEIRATPSDLIITTSICSEALLADIRDLKRPMICLDYQPAAVRIDSVCFNGIQAGETMGKMLAEYGHTDILYISRFYRDLRPLQGTDPWGETLPSADRRVGLTRGVVGTQADVWPVFPWYSGLGVGRNTKAECYERLRRTCEGIGRYPSAIVTVDLGVAYDVLDMLESLHLRVPDDVSLAGFHAVPSNEEAQFPPRPLTRVQLSWVEMGEAAWALAEEHLQSSEPLARPPKSVLTNSLCIHFGSVARKK